MKKMHLFCLLILLFSCKEEDLTGQITFIFEDIRLNEIDQLQFSIFLSEYTVTPLRGNIKPDIDGNLVVSGLNPGNYIYRHNVVNCNNNCQREGVFQIIAGEEKSITIPRNGGFGI